MQKITTASSAVISFEKNISNPDRKPTGLNTGYSFVYDFGGRIGCVGHFIVWSSSIEHVLIETQVGADFDIPQGVVQKVEGEYILPKEAAQLIFAMLVQVAREHIAKKVAGTYLDKYPLPNVNVETMITADILLPGILPGTKK